MQSERDSEWLNVLGRGVSRRGLLRGGALGAAGLATAALIGCGDDEDEEEPATTTPAAGGSDNSGSSGSDDDGGTAAADIEYPNGVGTLVQDPNLPFPYNFPEPEKAPKAGGIMKVANTWDVGPMDPTVSAAGGTVVIPNMIYNRLLGIRRGPQADPFKLELSPELAQSWERSPDGLTFTFHITPGVTWQNIAPLNGRAFTAEDAAYALNRYRSEGVHKSYYVNVDSIEAVDDSTLKINMAKASADFLNPLGSNKQTIFPRELVDDGTIADRAIGTGPMILKEAIASDRVTFDKNPDYWEQDILLDGFEFRVMPDHASRLAAFRAGQVDYAYSVVNTQTDVKALQGTNPDIQINMTVNPSGTPFGFALDSPKWQDERVRRAVSLAIDRETVNAVVNEGLGTIGNVIPWTFLYDAAPSGEELGNWTRFAPEEAKQLLAAAGHEDGLTINSIYFAYGGYVDQTSEVLTDLMREAGITLNDRSVDYTQFNSQWVGGNLDEASTIAWAASGFDADNWFFAHIHSESPGNRWKLSDPQLDEWAEAQQLELDPEARREIWQNIWDRDLEMAYRPVMVARPGFEIYQPWLRGIRWNASVAHDNSSYYDWGDSIAGAWLDK